MRYYFCVLLLIINLLGSGSLSSANAQVASTSASLPQPSFSFPDGLDSVSVPFQLSLNKILIPVSVNNSRPLTFVLDTGWLAPAFNNPNLAAELNLRSGSKTDVRGAGNGPVLQAGIVSDVNFDISGFRLNHLSLLLPPDSAARPRLGTWDGIIGCDVFKNAVVEIDSVRKIIKLYKPENYKYEGRGVIIPLTINERGIAFVEAELDLNGKTAPVKLIADTGFGSAVSLVTDSIAGARTPPNSIETIIGFGASGKVTGHAGRTGSFKLGGFKFDNLLTQFDDAASGTVFTQLGANGLIGHEITRRFKMIFDYSRSRMILEPNRFLKDRFEYPMTGIVFAPRAGDSSLKVLDVLKESPAQKAGIESGDQITAINGKPVSAYTEDELFALYRQENKTLRLTVNKNGQTGEKKIKLTRLV